MIDRRLKPIAAAIAGRYSMIRINHPWGHGDWFHASDRDALQAVCDKMNSTYGDGTHYVHAEEASTDD